MQLHSFECDFVYELKNNRRYVCNILLVNITIIRAAIVLFTSMNAQCNITSTYSVTKITHSIVFETISNTLTLCYQLSNGTLA